MATTLTNYDGSIVTTPQQYVEPRTVEEIQAVLRAPDQYPGPVRAVGSYHSLTPCASSPGTILGMKKMNRVVKIDPVAMTFTAEAGLEMIEASRILREQKLQFLLNIEIGNMTLGSAACCQTKDSLDGTEFGQVNSYVTGVKWVGPSGTLEEATEESDPARLSLFRGSYGLLGIVYEVTFRIKPLECVRFNYHVHDVASLTQDMVSDAIATNGSVVFWTVGRSVVIQTRNRAEKVEHEWLGGARRFGWNFLAAFLGRAVREFPAGTVRDVAEDLETGVELGFYRLLSFGGGFTLENPDKTVDYSKTPEAARYAFTFWAFPRADWVHNLNAYLAFAEEHHRQHGFRCNMPLGSYFIRQDRHSLLSYTWDGDVISIDPIHAPADERDKAGWARFLEAFNEWAAARHGVPLLNQSPYVTRAQVVAAYGDRWTTLSNAVRAADPQGRLLNDYFRELLA